MAAFRTPRELAALRRRTEQAIEALIALLDELDAPHEDLEASVEGPAEYRPVLQLADLEGDDGAELETSGDDEPSLGWTDTEARTGRYGAWSTAGLEV